jgi:hypothetical protein
MSGSGVVGAVLVTVALMLMNCGGRDTTNPSGADDGTTMTQGGGGSASVADACLGGAADGGCGGEAGERPLEPYARLRTACGRSVMVNRQGGAASICFHIK